MKTLTLWIMASAPAIILLSYSKLEDYVNHAILSYLIVPYATLIWLLYNAQLVVLALILTVQPPAAYVEPTVPHVPAAQSA